MRVHELAKELEIPSGELIEVIQELGIDAKSHSSGLDEDQVERVRLEMTGSEEEIAAYEARKAGVEPPAPKVEEAPAEVASSEEASSEEASSEEAATEDKPAEVSTAEEAPAVDAEAPTAEAPVAGAEEAALEEAPEEEVDDTLIVVKGPIVVKDLADRMNMRPNQLVAQLMKMNIFASINQPVEVKVAQKLAVNNGYRVEKEEKKKAPPPPPPPVDLEGAQEPTKKKKTKEKRKKKGGKDGAEPVEGEEIRPCVVTFLGHVDHGKTSLLDYIRKEKVAAGEDGGITQHIGAYQVDVNDHKISFIDTPGHAAFTSMRARGANLTDIAVIIVAADDGIMPQTKEAIQHAQAAGVTVMVAINKVDLPAANIDRVKQMLQAEGLSPEDWGGETICCPVSAMTGEGVDELLEMILLQAEVLELRALPTGPGKGFVIEAQLEAGRGPTANILVTEGMLKIGDAVVCGPCWGKVKSLIDDRGKVIKKAGPSTPVKLMGLTSVPEAGMEFEVYPNDRKARAEAESRQQADRQESLESPAQKMTLEDLFSQATESAAKKELALVLKTDVQGSSEAIQQALMEIQSDKVVLNILLAGVGSITTNDVMLASASDAIVLGFQVGKEGQVNSLTKREGVEVRLYSVIYELLDDVRAAMTGLLDMEDRENILGYAEIKQVFDMGKRDRVAGCLATKGRIRANAHARVKRNRDVIYDGSIHTLRRFQNEAAEVRDGQECGIRLEKFSNFEVGDIIEVYEVEQVAQVL